MTDKKLNFAAGCLLAASFFLCGAFFNKWSYDKLVEKCHRDMVYGWSDTMGIILWPIVSLSAATTKHEC